MAPVLLLLQACGTAARVETVEPEPVAVQDSAGDDTADTGTEHIPTDTAPPEVAVESVGDQDTSDLDGWLFGLDTIRLVDITLNSDSYDSLAADPYTFVVGDVRIDGETVENVGVRLRGKIGSARTIAQKPKFKIDFDEYIEDQRFYGLESLSLNNSVVDCSYLKEPLGYEVFRAAGVPALRTGYAWVTVNGADYGLYVLLETPDDRFLDRVYEDPTGNFYDGKYVWYGGYSYTLLDFGTGVDALYQLEEGMDVANADIAAISTALTAYQGTADFYTQLGALFDWEEFHREWAAEQWIGHLDGYAQNTNNYRVYFDPTDGKADIIPWDLDYAFLPANTWGMAWTSPRGQIAAWCLRDAACVADHKAAVSELVTTLEATDLAGFLAQADALTSEAAAVDPRRECSGHSVASYRAGLQTWIAGQNASMRQFWGI